MNRKLVILAVLLAIGFVMSERTLRHIDCGSLTPFGKGFVLAFGKACP